MIESNNFILIRSNPTLKVDLVCQTQAHRFSSLVVFWCFFFFKSCLLFVTNYQNTDYVKSDMTDRTSAAD
jgi:hypothetical protein